MLHVWDKISNVYMYNHCSLATVNSIIASCFLINKWHIAITGMCEHIVVLDCSALRRCNKSIKLTTLTNENSGKIKTLVGIFGALIVQRSTWSSYTNTFHMYEPKKHRRFVFFSMVERICLLITTVFVLMIFLGLCHSLYHKQTNLM